MENDVLINTMNFVELKEEHYDVVWKQRNGGNYFRRMSLLLLVV